MATITVEAPFLQDMTAKQKMMERLTETIAEAYRMPMGSIVVVVKEQRPKAVAVGGEMIVDRRVA